MIRFWGIYGFFNDQLASPNAPNVIFYFALIFCWDHTQSLLLWHSLSPFQEGDSLSSGCLFSIHNIHHLWLHFSDKNHAQHLGKQGWVILKLKLRSSKLNFMNLIRFLRLRACSNYRRVVCIHPQLFWMNLERMGFYILVINSRNHHVSSIILLYFTDSQQCLSKCHGAQQQRKA